MEQNETDVMEQNNTKQTDLSRILVCIIMIIVLLFHNDSLGKMKVIYILPILLGLVLGFIIGIIIHEIGHLILGLCSGYQLVSFRIFSHTWTIKNRKTSYKRNKRAIEILGQCLMSPKHEYSKDIKYLAFNRGGYIFNLFTALILYGLTFIPSINQYVFYFLLSIIFTQLHFFSTNFVPLNSPIPNDGYNIKICKRYPDSRKAMYVQLFLVGKLNEGHLYSDFIDMYEFDIQKVAEQLPLFSVAYYKFCALIELGKIEEAVALHNQLYKLVEYLPLGFRNAVIAQEAINQYLFKDKEKFMEIVTNLPEGYEKIINKVQKQEIAAMLALCNAAISDINYEDMRTNFEFVIETNPNIGEKFLYLKFLEFINEKYNFDKIKK